MRLNIIGRAAIARGADDAYAAAVSNGPTYARHELIHRAAHGAGLAYLTGYAGELARGAVVRLVIRIGGAS